MAIGGHSLTHRWLNKIGVDAQRNEIEASARWLKELGVSWDAASFSYPFGGYDSHTLSEVERAGFKVAFTTKVAVNSMSNVHPLEISRIDATDMQKMAFR
jgi:peptidoglycan/xylan/chitin deacetylase (PgdA/CDA1 family)